MRRTVSSMIAQIGTNTWRALTIVCMLALYAVAISNSAYELTTPAALPYHVALRKTYALGAFALLGFLFEESAFPRLRGIAWSALVVGLFSTAIELGQTYISGSPEPMSEHVFDVASGVAGGALGSWIAMALEDREA